MKETSFARVLLAAACPGALRLTQSRELCRTAPPCGRGASCGDNKKAGSKTTLLFCYLKTQYQVTLRTAASSKIILERSQGTAPCPSSGGGCISIDTYSAYRFVKQNSIKAIPMPSPSVTISS